MSNTTDFIIINPISGQFTLHLPNIDLNFLIIKKYACDHTWSFIKDSPLNYFPVLSTSADENDFDRHIDESMPLSAYNLQNGGIVFLHYILINMDD